MAASKLSEALFGVNGTGSELLQFLAESGYLWSYRGKFDKAVPIFEALMALAPSDPVGYMGLAETYMSAGKFKDADRIAEQAARTSRIDRRTLAFAYKLRGKALMQLKKSKDAEKLLRKAVELDPKGEEGRAAQQLIEIATKLGLLAADPVPK
jgi:tetratricopeptide (TPR) repeat protein